MLLDCFGISQYFPIFFPIFLNFHISPPGFPMLGDCFSCVLSPKWPSFTGFSAVMGASRGQFGKISSWARLWGWPYHKEKIEVILDSDRLRTWVELCQNSRLNSGIKRTGEDGLSCHEGDDFATNISPQLVNNITYSSITQHMNRIRDPMPVMRANKYRISPSKFSASIDIRVSGIVYRTE